MINAVLSPAILTIFPAAMVIAAASDLFTMKISNRLTGGLAVAFFALALISGMEFSVFLWHLAAGGVALTLVIALFAPGWIGGGDAKLLAVTALWLGWGPLAYYAFISVVAGGALTFALLWFRGMPLPAWAGGQGWIERLHRADNGAPYGIALAVAGLAAYSHSIWLTGGFV